MSVVIITGSNSGIGRAAALAFARDGATVYATMRDIANAADLRAEAEGEGLELQYRALDVTLPHTFTGFVDDVLGGSGCIDVLVNNAGILRAGAFEDFAETSLREIMETNFIGPMLLTQAVLPQMRKQRSGYVIMMSSLSGIAGLPGDVAYSASKFALEGATEALRHEVDRWNIKVALVQAGMYATRIFHPSANALATDGLRNSPYAPLIENRVRTTTERLPEALDPQAIGELFVEIASSDGTQLRWPADDVAKKVLHTMLAQDDRARDAFLREVAESDWWSQGKKHPGERQ